MEYKIHGVAVWFDGVECGIYKSSNPVERPKYAVMDMNSLVCQINNLSKEKAIGALISLRDMAAEQAVWKNTPQNLGFPALIQTGGIATPIDKVRINLENTERFCNDILKALEGK